MNENDDTIRAPAAAIASLLPSLMRHLFAATDGLAAELPLAQLRVCGILYVGPQSMSAISRELGVSLSAMTQIADRLERAGLVERLAEGTDRRVRLLQLTDHGQQVMRHREAERIRRVSAVLEHLPPQVRKEGHAVLETLLEAAKATKNQETLPHAAAGRALR
jgi:DNA-binding MarR family transcriptional regulator